MSAEMNPGEAKAWDIIASSNPEEICRNAAVSYDKETRCYLLRSLGMDFKFFPEQKTIESSSPGSDVLLKRLGYFFRLAALWYLAGAKNIDCTGRLMKLELMSGGNIFTRGSHVLPLAGVAEKYGADKEAFLEKGRLLGGEYVPGGDAAIRLWPLPRVPAVLVLWLTDEEFPARVDLLFDSTCELHLATDVVWTVAMMSVLVMM
jgi:hypothetical protein